MHRRTKLTPEVHNLIVEAIRVGNYVETAAQAAGINKTTLYRWLEQGEDDDADVIYRNFRNAVESARAEAEKMDLDIINRAAHDGSWQAAAWKLERRTPQRWGRVNRTEISGLDGSTVKVEISPKETLQAKLSDMLSRAQQNAELLDGDDD